MLVRYSFGGIFFFLPDFVTIKLRGFDVIGCYTYFFTFTNFIIIQNMCILKKTSNKTLYTYINYTGCHEKDGMFLKLNKKQTVLVLKVFVVRLLI